MPKGDGNPKERRGRRPLTNSSSGFPGWLIEPSLDIILPMLLEVPIRDNIVVLNHGLPVKLGHK